MKKTLILIFLLFGHVLFSYNSRIDSLQNALFKASGSNRITILNQLSYEFWELNPQKSIKYAEDAYELAKKEKNFPEQINALINIAVAKEVENDTASARKYYFSAIELAEKNNVAQGIARAKKDYGIMLSENYENEKSLNYLLDALKLYREVKDTLQQSYVYSYIIRNYDVLNDNENALKYALENLNLLKGSRFKSRIADAFLLAGNVYEERGCYFEAIQNYKNALKYFKEINDVDGMATSYNFLGNVNEILSDYDKALDYYYKSLLIYEQQKDYAGISTAYNNIGNIYFDMKNYEGAEKYYADAYEIYHSEQNKSGEGTYFNNMANIFSAQKKYDKALEMYEKAKTIYSEIGDKEGISTCLNNMGIIYFDTGKYEKALELFINSLNISKDIEDEWAIANTSNNIAELYYRTKKYKDALKYVNKALQIATRLHLKAITLESYSNLSKIYAALADYEKAYKFLSKQATLKDSIYTDNLNKIAMLETKFATEKKEKEIQLLQRQKKYQKLIKEIFLTVSFFAFIVIFWLIFLYNKNLQEIRRRKQAESELRASEEKYRSLTEHLKAAVYTFDKEGYFTYVNPATIEITGYSEKELLSMKFFEIVHPESRELVKERGLKRVQGKEPISHYEFRILTKSGEEKWVEISNVFLQIKNEKFVLGTAIDITANKQARIIQNVLFQILKAINTSDNLKELYSEIHGYLKEVMNVDNFYIALYDEEKNIISAPFYRDQYTLKTPKPQQLKNGLTAYVIRTGKPLFLTVEKRNELIRKKEIADIEWKSKVWLGVPLISKGKIIGVMAVQSYNNPDCYTERDLKILELVSDQIALAIEKKRIEEALRESEARFREIVHDQTELICRSDTEGKLTFVNQALCKYFRKNRDELLGNSLGTYMLPEDIEEIKRKLSNLNILNPVIVYEQKMVINQQLRWVEWTDRKLFDKEGNFIGFQSVGRDITDRKHWVEKMQDSLREKEILLQEIHHRVKNNMQVISSLLKLQSSKLDNEEIKELFMESYNRVRSMALIHENLYQSSDLSRIDFYSYTKSLLNNLTLTYGIDKRKIKFNFEIKSIFLDIGTAIPCGLIINELISNSLKYAFPDGREGEISISLDFDKESGYYEMIIQDNGIGLPKDFDFENSSTFGLELVHILTEQLHGKIEIKNENGTFVKFIFKSRA